MVVLVAYSESEWHLSHLKRLSHSPYACSQTFLVLFSPWILTFFLLNTYLLAWLVECGSVFTSHFQWFPDPVYPHCACGRALETVRTHLSVRMRGTHPQLNFHNCNTLWIIVCMVDCILQATISSNVKCSSALRISHTMNVYSQIAYYSPTAKLIL